LLKLCAVNLLGHDRAVLCCSCLWGRRSDRGPPRPQAFCRKTEAPGGRRDGSFLHQSRAASNEPQPQRLSNFRQFLSENRNQGYHPIRV